MSLSMGAAATGLWLCFMLLMASAVGGLILRAAIKSLNGYPKYRTPKRIPDPPYLKAAMISAHAILLCFGLWWLLACLFEFARARLWPEETVHFPSAVGWDGLAFSISTVSCWFLIAAILAISLPTTFRKAFALTYGLIGIVVVIVLFVVFAGFLVVAAFGLLAAAFR